MIPMMIWTIYPIFKFDESESAIDPTPICTLLFITVFILKFLLLFFSLSGFRAHSMLSLCTHLFVYLSVIIWMLSMPVVHKSGSLYMHTPRRRTTLIVV